MIVSDFEGELFWTQDQQQSIILALSRLQNLQSICLLVAGPLEHPFLFLV